VLDLRQKEEVKPVAPRLNLAWGGDEIARIIGRRKRATFHMLGKGAIKSARKVGGVWVANIDNLLREFGVDV
jgi:hypothetical protein